MNRTQAYLLTHLCLCPVIFLNLLMFGADLVVNENVFHAGAILLLKVNFLTFVLLYSTYNLYSTFLVMSDFVAVKTKNVSNFK